MKINNKWRLYYSENNVNLEKIETLNHFDSVKIPTLFENEIWRNKLLGDPYFSTNNWEYQKYENYHQYYVKTFNSRNECCFLKLNGIDTISDVYVNGKLVGKTDNCFLPFTFKLEGLKKKNNKLIIHIFPSVIEGLKYDFSSIRQVAKYNYESLNIRKPASSFGWDILPRTPLGGIYKDVELIEETSLFDHLRIVPTDVTSERAVLAIFNDESVGVSFEINGICKTSKFHKNFERNTIITVENPFLWNVRGYGEQNLYRIKINAIKNGRIIETKTIEYGIRKVLLKRTSVVKDGGCFEFYINDKKIFVLGSNWVPVDAIKHLDNKRAFKALKMLVDLGCNAIRIWGGGTYETDEVYHLCDKLGIFVWQDFMMGCATYPQDVSFQNKIKTEANYIVNKLFNHCSICLWAGDNENDCASCQWAVKKENPNTNVLTRKVLPEVLNELDNSRPYLPSSPFIDDYAYSHIGSMLSEDHLWGPRDYFKGEYYLNAYPYFTSETGYHGLNSPKSLNKFMKKPWPIFDENGNPTKEYMCHGVTVRDELESPYAYRTKLMADQVKTLFTNEFNNLNDFSLASQISQAEAMKFFIEKMRRDTKRNGGIIWWNILDGWPQVSDAIVDYYFCKKLAYNYIKMSQQKLLVFGYETNDELQFYISSLENHDDNVNYVIFDAANKSEIIKGNILCEANESKCFLSIPRILEKKFLIIEYTNKAGEKFINTFHTNINNIDYNEYVKILKKWKYFKL